MFNLIWVAEQSKGTFIPPDTTKYYMVSPRSLADNVILGVYNVNSSNWVTHNEVEGISFNGKNGPISMGMLLKPETHGPDPMVIGSALWQFGRNTSFDEQQDDFAVSLIIEFMQAPPNDVNMPVFNNELPMTKFKMEGIDIRNSDDGRPFYVDLKQISMRSDYCRIRVKEAPGTNTDMIEGKVMVYLSISSTIGKNKLIAIYGNNDGSGQEDMGTPADQVVNKDFYFSLKNEQQAYLFAMVNPKKNGNHFTFEVGDPRDDADVDVEEV